MMKWRINRPAGTEYWKLASCAEVNCRNYINGWRTILPSTDLSNIEWIRRSSMDFTEERQDGLVVFHFAPGQQCFDGELGRHRIPHDRDPVMSLNKRIMEPLEYMDTWNNTEYRRGING